MAKVRTIPGVVDVDSQLRADAARAARSSPTAPGRRTSASTSIRSPRACARSSAARSVGSSRTATSSTSVRLRLDEGSATTRRTWAAAGAVRDAARPSGSATSRSSCMDYGPASIDRYNRQRQISVSANLDKVPLGDVVAAARVKVAELNLKPGYQAVFGGKRAGRSTRRPTTSSSPSCWPSPSSTWCSPRSSTASSTRSPS